MGKETFIIYCSFYKPISILSDKQLGRLFRAIFEYNLGEVVNVEDDIRMAFEFFKNQFILDESKYQAKVMRDVENGRKGGNPNFAKGKKNPYYSDITQDNPPLCKITQDNPPLCKITINDNDNDNDNVISISSSPNVEEETSDFTKSRTQSNEKFNLKKIIDYWNSCNLKSINTISPGTSRHTWACARIRQYGEKNFIEAIKKASLSEYLKNANWFTFDWFVRPTNFQKVLDGNYDDKIVKLKSDSNNVNDIWK